MKRARPEADGPPPLLDALPDDVLLLVLLKLSCSASRPADLLSVLPTCKRLNALAGDPSVLAAASPGALSVAASNWSDSAHSFLKRCSAIGNPHASYILGTIMFYCRGERKEGIAEMAKAGMKGHAGAIYSLAVIHFNGSGWAARCAAAIRVGAVLLARAAALGHLAALRELGHCLEDGYGLRRDLARGRRCLAQAAAREAEGGGAPDGASGFLVGWFQGKEGVGMCWQRGCGRREMRRMEFRRCAGCGEAGYCSRVCQALDWTARHRAECSRRRIVVPLRGGGGDAAPTVAAVAGE